MGGSQSSENRGSNHNHATIDRPLIFHMVHGENIKLMNDGRTAKRGDSFCKGICFSNRPIHIGERVFIKYVGSSGSWSGVLRFGFTSTDPNTLQKQTLPRYACPDMTNKPGNWAKALNERYAVAGNELFFYVTESGDVFYGVNGEEKGLFFSGIIASVPLWVLLDIYGNTSCVEFTNPPPQPLNNMLPNQLVGSTLSGTPKILTSRVSSLTFSTDNQNNNRNDRHIPTNLPLSHLSSTQLSPLPFHDVCGRNIRLSPDQTVATRKNEKYCNAYVFTSRPLRCGEKIIIQVLSVDRSFIGGLVFGFTSVDPSNLQPTDLPDDANLFLDHSEYWVVNKDVCQNPKREDELGFHLTAKGAVLYCHNNDKVSTLMQVDTTLPLWAFFDVYGNVQKIKILGVTVPQEPELRGPLPRSHSSTSDLTVCLPPPPPQRHSMAPTTLHLHSQRLPAMLRSISQPAPLLPQSPLTPKSYLQSVSMPATPSSVNEPVADNESNECNVCYERPVNAVLYMCGHMCMCFECAQAVRQEQTPVCPICRQEIKDIIKIYRS